MGNGGRPAPHHPIPGYMWAEGLSTADRPQKKKMLDVLDSSKVASVDMQTLAFRLTAITIQAVPASP